MRVSKKSNHLNKLNKQKLSSRVFPILIIVFIGIGGLFSYRYIDQHEQIMTVDNEPIYRVEFESGMKEQYANTYDYFNRTYGAEIDKDFWNNTYEGESPLIYTKEIVKEQLITRKLEQILAKERKLIKRIDYFSWLNQWEAENQRREIAIKNDEPVYGPVYLGEKQYFEQTLGELRQKIKEDILKEKEFKDSDIEEYYMQNKDQFFKKEAEIEIQYIKVPIAYVKEDIKEEEKDLEIKKLLSEFIDELDNGKDFELTSEKYKGENKDIRFEYSIEKLDESTQVKANMTYPQVLVELQDMKEGDISEIIEERTAYYIVKCISKSDATYKPLSEVKEVITKLFIEQEYEDLIAQFNKNYKVEIDDIAYEKLKAS